MKTLSIPAALNGTPGVYTENVGDPGFTIVSATGSFFIQVRNNQQFKASVGQQVGAASGPSLGRVTFSNPSAQAIDVILGDFNSVVQPVPADLLNVNGQAVTNLNLSKAWGYNVRDTSNAADPGTFAAYSAAGFNWGSIFSSSFPNNKPYRRFWAYVAAQTFPAGEAIYLNFFLGGHPAINPNASLVLSLPVRDNMLVPPVGTAASWAPTHFGFGQDTDSDNANRVCAAGDMVYENTDGSTHNYQVKPFDFYCVADTWDLGKTNGVTGNIRAFVAMLSTEVRI